MYSEIDCLSCSAESRSRSSAMRSVTRVCIASSLLRSSAITGHEDFGQRDVAAGLSHDVHCAVGIRTALAIQP